LFDNFRNIDSKSIKIERGVCKMIYLFTVWMPPNKQIEAAKIYLELPREVPHIRKWRVFNTTGGKDGNKQYHLVYTEKGKGDEALQALVSYFMPLTTKIEGIRTRVEVLMGVTDSYKALGMSWES
jgi:hypothetical protein